MSKAVEGERRSAVSGRSVPSKAIASPVCQESLSDVSVGVCTQRNEISYL